MTTMQPEALRERIAHLKTQRAAIEADWRAVTKNGEQGPCYGFPPQQDEPAAAMLLAGQEVPLPVHVDSHYRLALRSAQLLGAITRGESELAALEKANA